jgi:hypothetical protein
MMKEYLIEAWECWDGSEGKHQYKHVYVLSHHEAEIEGLEFAFTLLDPYMNEIKHYAKYMFERGYDYEDTLHNTMLECAHYELWVKA